MAQSDSPAEVFKRGDSFEMLAACQNALHSIKQPDGPLAHQRWSTGEVWVNYKDQLIAHHNQPSVRAEAEALFRQGQTFVDMLNWKIFLQANKKFDEYERLLNAVVRQNEQDQRSKQNKNKKAPRAPRITIKYVAINRLNISQSELVKKLQRYVVAPQLLRTYGFPVESIKFRGKVTIYKKLPCLSYEASTNTDDNEDPIELERQFVPDEDNMKKQCVRCERTFKVTQSGFYVTLENCTFHWGKLFTLRNTVQYTCCAGSEESVGCTTNSVHVWNGVVSGINGPYNNFVRTTSGPQSAEAKVYVLDCEMSYTASGLAATKVTVIDFDGQLVYEHFVRPIADVVDYNTRFSGVRARDVYRRNKNVKTLRQVQRDLLKIIDANTILIGHGLENDLRVLRILHKTVVDTSIVFPHYNGFPHRHSLKYLAKTYLNRYIQLRGRNHDSLEDTRICLELMLWKVGIDMKRS
ncbi:putative exonuclease GOR [Zeugodacus cucurbitae]|uniref:putative exonuclease GOR n=1 Tax=Zeugodacus cucurbitae TaxID=28588 RepID=UPI0023D93C8D|nr:putative exonuclease GOR [Zeugodacus cucurbitae]